ncbi:unnamed protein product [Cuscuta epithymum]|uniref:Xylanase inhibitor N-terminal domain-containing protein n=1 Tax=Cuscuta epithymum TaxID=186058 RepID=A0AAV0DEY7_9ASTE|nr:unnamed protein product [Cuscuta epithymum]
MKQIRFLNSYNPKSSSTSTIIPCRSPECWPKQKQCHLMHKSGGKAVAACPYQVDYMTYNTSSKGILVKDILHLETYDQKRRPCKAPIIFRCGMIETGANLEDGTINGLLGLGFNTPLDLPGMLASQGLVPNSFSLCFGLDGKGRLAFGDKGSSAHMRTPLDPDDEDYNIQIEKICVDDIVSNVAFVALVDSGTSFTRLNEQAFFFIAENNQSHDTSNTFFDFKDERRS